jgi:uncharacterized membrane protein (GlpM family)
MDYLYTVLKFIIGGSVIVGVTYLAQQADPRYAGVLAAAPIMTTLAILFTYTETGQDAARQLVLGSFFFAIPSILFLLGLWFLMGRFGFLLGLGGAFGIWGGALFVMHRLMIAS